jgi:hypothetical protein
VTATKRCQQLERALENLVNAALEVCENPKDDTHLTVLFDEVKQAEEVLAAPYTEV